MNPRDDTLTADEFGAYPITANLRSELAKVDLVNESTCDYIGNYEHGSVDIDTLLTADQRAEMMSNNEDEAQYLMSERDLLQFAANVLHDYLLALASS